MNRRHILPALFALSLLLSVPSLLRLPRMLPFLNAEVRSAAPNALEELRSRGLWLVNVDLVSVERATGDICFVWEHRYRSRTAIADQEIITTCIR